jgi:hypothetical protein
MAKARTTPNKRSHKRQPFRHMARIFVEKDQPLIPCMILDISESGARIALKELHDLPAEFTLLLGPKGPVRKCQRMWQDGLALGVAFAGK